MTYYTALFYPLLKSKVNQYVFTFSISLSTLTIIIYIMNITSDNVLTNQQ